MAAPQSLGRRLQGLGSALVGGRCRPQCLWGSSSPTPHQKKDSSTPSPHRRRQESRCPDRPAPCRSSRPASCRGASRPPAWGGEASGGATSWWGPCRTGLHQPRNLNALDRRLPRDRPPWSRQRRRRDPPGIGRDQDQHAPALDQRGAARQEEGGVGQPAEQVGGQHSVKGGQVGRKLGGVALRGGRQSAAGACVRSCMPGVAWEAREERCGEAPRARPPALRRLQGAAGKPVTPRMEWHLQHKVTAGKARHGRARAGAAQGACHMQK